jgi:sarcosine oxidase subunit gamma
MSDVSLDEPAPRSVVGIGAYRARAPLLAALQDGFGLAPAATAGFTQSAGICLSCLSPSRYLATAEREANLPARLGEALGAYAAITDQSDLWHYFTLSGPGAFDALSRLVPVDLSPKAFPVGALALTRAGHLNVRLWHVGDHTFELAVARSYAGDLRYDLQRLL